MASKKNVRIQQIKRVIGYTERQRATMRGLGLRKIRQVGELNDTGAKRGTNGKVK